jgi:hypothetical protein
MHSMWKLLDEYSWNILNDIRTKISIMNSTVTTIFFNVDSEGKNERYN